MAPQTASPAPKTWTLNVTRYVDHRSRVERLTVSTTSGSKSLTIQTTGIDRYKLTNAEIDLVGKVRWATDKDEGGKVELTMDEMNMLRAIRDKTQGPGAAAERVLEGTAGKVATRVEQREVARGTVAGEAGVKRLEQAVDVLKGKLYLLIYDIPVAKDSDCPNPSQLLWHFGFRMNLSCWILPEKSLNAAPVQELLTHWREHGIEQHLIQQDPATTSQIREIAKKRLAEEVVRQHTSFIERIGAASDRLAAAEKALDEASAGGAQVTGTDYDKAQSKRNNQVRAIIKGAVESFQAALDCAALFDDTESTAHLFDGLRKAIKAEAEAFKAVVVAAGGKPCVEVS